MFGTSGSAPSSMNHGDNNAKNGSGGDIVGLDIGGKVFYMPVSMLSGSTYFQNRLLNNRNEATYTDSVGRKVLFVARSPELFTHVRDFLVSGGHVTAATTMTLDLRRALRREAEFFGLPSFAEALQVSHHFSPHANPHRGVLFWLGSSTTRITTKSSSSGTDDNNKNSNHNNYENPYAAGKIDVTGWFDDDDNAEEDMFDLARFARSRETFVEYRCRPVVQRATKKKAEWEMEQFSCLQWCQHANKRLPVIIDFKTTCQVRPTHYSLRVSECMGLAGDWNFEASHDAVEWDVLHAARGDTNLLLEEGNDEIKQQLTKTLSFYNDHVQCDELSADVLLQILEQDFRHTWKLEPAPTKFYRYFRFIGASDPDGEDACLHGEGLELFGDVYEH